MVPIRRVFARFSTVRFRYRYNKGHCLLYNFVSDLPKILYIGQTRSRRYFQVFSWFGRPTFAFRRKCARDAARIVCFCNLTTFFLTIILLARSLAFADLQSYNSCVFLGSLFFSPILDRKLSFSSVPSFFFICRDWMSAISHTVSKPTYFLLHFCTVN